MPNTRGHQAITSEGWSSSCQLFLNHLNCSCLMSPGKASWAPLSYRVSLFFCDKSLRVLKNFSTQGCRILCFSTLFYFLNKHQACAGRVQILARKQNALDLVHSLQEEFKERKWFVMISLSFLFVFSFSSPKPNPTRTPLTSNSQQRLKKETRF